MTYLHSILLVICLLLVPVSGQASDSYSIPSAGTGSLTAGIPNILNPIVINTLQTVAHGLGVKPWFVLSYLECLTAELGYSIGDRLAISDTATPTDSWTAEWDVTNTTIMVGNAPGAPNKSTNTFSTLTVGNWKLVFTPYKLN